MRPPSIWKTLGIKRTADRAEIRRAYAKRLKVTNPEDDPGGFQTLRQAFEWALSSANNAIARADFSISLDAEEDKTEDDDFDPIPAASPAPSEHEIAMGRLQYVVASRATPDEIIEAFAALMASPDIEVIDIHGRTESFVASLIIQQAPHADALIRPAAAAFQWEKRVRSYKQDWLLEQVERRARDLRYKATVAGPGRNYHSAWRALAEPPSPKALERGIVWTGLGHKVAQLLDDLDNDHPTLFAELDANAVRWWRDRLTRVIFPGGLWPWAVTLGLAVGLISLWPIRAMGPTVIVPIFLVITLGVGALIMSAAAIKSFILDFRLRAASIVSSGNRVFSLMWAPVGLGGIIAAGLAPPSVAVSVAAGLLGLILFVWAGFVSPVRHDVNRLKLPTWLNAAWPHVMLILGWLFTGGYFGMERWTQAAPLAILFILSFSLGEPVLDSAWRGLSLWQRRWALLLLMAACVGVQAALLRATAFNGDPLTALCLLTCVAVLSNRAFDYVKPGFLRARYIGVWVLGVLIGQVGRYADEADPNAVMLIGASLYLWSVAVLVLAAMTHEWAPRRRIA